MTRQLYCHVCQQTTHHNAHARDVIITGHEQVTHPSKHCLLCEATRYEFEAMAQQEVTFIKGMSRFQNRDLNYQQLIRDHETKNTINDEENSND